MPTTKLKKNKNNSIQEKSESNVPGGIGIRRFQLKRLSDESNVSGTGFVAEGVQFSDGTCIIKWKTRTSSIGIYHSDVEMIYIHGHGGKTIIEWIDDLPSETK